MKSKIAVAAVAAMALAFGAIQISNATTSPTYNACANKKSGALRLLAAGKKCTSKETKITWNQRGPQGAQGIQGAPGTSSGGGLSPIWVDASDFILTSGDAEYAYYGKSIVNGQWQQGFILEKRAPNTGYDDIEARFVRPSSWTGVTSVDITYYYTNVTGTGDVQLWKGFKSYVPGQAMSGLGWNTLHWGGFNGAGTLEYERKTETLDANAEVFSIGVERTSYTANSPYDTNDSDVIVIGALVEPIAS
ncbi:MAG: hypothetical protein RL410_1000 [Actinomycetota bacterium]|jgi:hypothetical protein